MKIARADKKDIDQALELMRILNAIDDGEHPDIECEDTFFDPDNPQHLRRFYDLCAETMKGAPGGLLRVIFGFAAIYESGVLDPDASALEVHPDIQKLLDIESRLDTRKTILDPQ
jgi:hypothetical protein